jgi:predicted DNA-binding transcriptional regulator YafY
MDVLAEVPRDADFNERVHRLVRAWAERRVVTVQYEPAAYAENPEATPRQAVVHPYLIEPSLQTHALYLIGFDETRGGLRTFKVERIRDVALTPRTFEAPEPGELERTLLRAWDIIADQPATRVVLHFDAAVAARVRETTWHSSQRLRVEPDGGLRFEVTVAGPIEIRLWILSWGDAVEVLEPPGLRDDVAATHARAAARYGAR